MTSTAPKNTRVSDLNKIIEFIDQTLEGKDAASSEISSDPEVTYLYIITCAYMNSLLNSLTIEEVRNTSLMALCADALSTVSINAEALGIEDTTLFLGLHYIVPQTIGHVIQELSGGQVIDLAPFGKLTVEDFTTEENN